MEISKSIFTQTIREVNCPKCGAIPNESCKTPKRKKTNSPHGERCLAYRNKISPEEFRNRHSLNNGKII